MVDLNRTQTALEFDKIKNILAEVCPTDGSKELAISLEPFIYEDEVRRSLKRTSEAKEMMTTKGMPPFGQIKDIRPILNRADKNAVLTLRELLDAANVLRTTRSLGNYIREGHDQAEYSIREIFERLMPEKRLEDRIFRSIVSEDMVADDASTALADIRRKCGKMLDAGATTFWETELGAEDFGGAGSLCHGWSALAVHYFVRLGAV